VYAGLWWRNMKERDHLEGLDIGGGIILKWIFNKWDGDGEIRIGLIWLRMRTDGGRLWKR
jgi:hypothetical protein